MELMRTLDEADVLAAALHNAVMQEYAVRYIHDNHWYDDPFLVMTPRGPLVVQCFYADEEHGGMYDAG